MTTEALNALLTELKAPMTEVQRQLFDAEYAQQAKDGGIAFLCAFFLGGLGIHHFYMRAWITGIFYLVFCWTFVPLVLGVIEAFVQGGRVARYNAKHARVIAGRIRVAAERHTA